MLDNVKLQLLTQAVERDDRITAEDVCLELSLAAKATADEFYVEALAQSIRLRDTECSRKLIAEITRSSANSPDEQQHR